MEIAVAEGRNPNCMEIVPKVRLSDAAREEAARWIRVVPTNPQSAVQHAAEYAAVTVLALSPRDRPIDDI